MAVSTLSQAGPRAPRRLLGAIAVLAVALVVSLVLVLSLGGHTATRHTPVLTHGPARYQPHVPHPAGHRHHRPAATDPTPAPCRPGPARPGCQGGVAHDGKPLVATSSRPPQAPTHPRSRSHGIAGPGGDRGGSEHPEAGLVARGPLMSAPAELADRADR
jgi:hypothetical protein